MGGQPDRPASIGSERRGHQARRPMSDMKRREFLTLLLGAEVVPL